MILTSPYFLLSITQNEYEELRTNRTILLAKNSDLSIENESVIIVYTKDDNKVHAEYDIDNLDDSGGQLQLTVEPIYNSPNGIELTDLILLTLTTYSLDNWRANLENHLTGISERDYTELINRLKG